MEEAYSADLFHSQSSAARQILYVSQRHGETIATQTAADILGVCDTKQLSNSRHDLGHFYSRLWSERVPYRFQERLVSEVVGDWEAKFAELKVVGEKLAHEHAQAVEDGRKAVTDFVQSAIQIESLRKPAEYWAPKRRAHRIATFILFCCSLAAALPGVFI